MRRTAMIRSVSSIVMRMRSYHTMSRAARFRMCARTIRRLGRRIRSRHIVTRRVAILRNRRARVIWSSMRDSRRAIRMMRAPQSCN